MTRRALCAWMAAVVAAVLVGCGPSERADGGTRRLSIATGGTGGVYYPYGGGVAKVLSDHLPNVDATAEVTAASVDNLKFLRQGTSDIAFSMADTALDGVAGRDMFQEFGPVPARALAVLYPNYTHLVTSVGSGISNVADLRGKVVSVGAPGAGTAVVAEKCALNSERLRFTGLRASPQRDETGGSDSNGRPNRGIHRAPSSYSYGCR